MSTESRGENQYVTHAEFSAFRDNTESTLRRIETSLKEIQRDRGLSNYLPMIAIAAGAIVWIITAQTGPTAAALDKHIALEGHPQAMQRQARMEENIDRLDGDMIETRGTLSQLDINLQREMRDLDAINATEIQNLDERLQREMRDLLAPLDARIAINSSNLASRAGHRFNMPDYERLVDPRLTELERKMDDVRESRFTGARGAELLQRLSRLEAFVERIENEQDYRRPKVPGLD